MKLIVASLYLSFASLVVTGNPRDGTYGYDDVCFQNYTISLPEGKCNYDAIVTEMTKTIDEDPDCGQGTKAADELRALFFIQDLTDIELEEKINLACEDAYFELMYGDGITYANILADNNNQVKEYFDGRGCINTNHELSRTMGVREDILTTFPFQWPGDANFGYNKQIPATVKSQFIRDHWFKFNEQTETTDRYGRKIAKPSKRGRKESIEEGYYPAENFDQCKLNTAMCCWTESRVSHNNTDHNTDICYVNMAEAPTSSRVKSGFAIFPGATNGSSSGSGPVQCHGFSWAEDPTDVTNPL